MDLTSADAPSVVWTALITRRRPEAQPANNPELQAHDQARIPVEQEARLREIALWNLVNQEAILAVRPWVVTDEGDVWFTKAKDASTVYAVVTRTDWPWGTPKTFTLRSVEATASTEVSVLG